MIRKTQKKGKIKNIHNQEHFKGRKHQVYKIQSTKMSKYSEKQEEEQILNYNYKKKSCIRETPNLSTDADRSTNTNEICVIHKSI